MNCRLLEVKRMGINHVLFQTTYSLKLYWSSVPRRMEPVNDFRLSFKSRVKGFKEIDVYLS